MVCFSTYLSNHEMVFVTSVTKSLIKCVDELGYSMYFQRATGVECNFMGTPTNSTNSLVHLDLIQKFLDIYGTGPLKTFDSGLLPCIKSDSTINSQWWSPTDGCMKIQSIKGLEIISHRKLSRLLRIKE